MDVLGIYDDQETVYIFQCYKLSFVPKSAKWRRLNEEWWINYRFGFICKTYSFSKIDSSVWLSQINFKQSGPNVI